MLELAKQTLLVIAPHLDDEVLGCAGLIKHIKDAGGKVYVLFLTVGNTKDYSNTGFSGEQERVEELTKVAKYLKLDGYRIAFPGNEYHLRLDQLAQKQLIYEIEAGKDVSINAVKPTIIATPQASDYNQDHQACAKATLAAVRPAPADFKYRVKMVLGYEYAASSNWSIAPLYQPNFYLELTKQGLKAKIKAMDLYASQARGGSHPRSNKNIESLAYLRGAQCGADAAEAYYIYRLVEGR